MKSRFFNHKLNRRAGARTLVTLTAGLALLAIIGWSWLGLRTALAWNPAGDYLERTGKWRSLAATSAPLQANGPVCSNFGNKTTLSGLGHNQVYDVYAVDSTVYAATSDGLSISYNGGANFTNISPGNELGSNSVLGVYAADTAGYGRVVYAATRGGLSISYSGGTNFINKTTANGLGSNIVYDAYAVGLTVYAATNGGLSILTNASASFTNRTTANGLGSNIVLDVYAPGTTIYAATFGGLSISTNGGASFTNKTTANGLGGNVVYGVYVAGTTVYAATNGGLSISTNGGASFTNRTTANGLGNNIVYGVYAVGATIYAATNGGLSISTDGGASFANYTTASGLGGNSIQGVHATATSIYAATNGGLSLCPPLPADINVTGNSLTIASGDQMPDAADGTDFGNAAANTNVVVRNFTIESRGTGELHLTGTPKVALGGTNSADFSIAMQPDSPVRGVTTFLVNFAPTATGVRTAAVSIANNDENENPYIFAIRGTGTPTPNGPVCTNFTNKGTGSGLGNNSVEAVHTVGSTVYAATANGLAISTNGGASFSNRTTASGLGSNTVYDVYAAGTTVYAATANGLAISTNGGASFTNRTTSSGLGNNAVRGVYAAGTMVYAATEGGLAISTNSGTSFTNRTTAHGLGHNFVFGVYAVGTTVYAATNGGGLAISTNGGTSFTNRTTANGLGNNVVRDTYVAGTTVYAATAGGLSISTNSGASFINRTNTSGLSSVFGVHAAGTTVYAATFLGLMISTNGGASFTSYTTANGLGNSFVRGVYATATSIYAATPGGLSLCPPPVPEINVRGNNVTIANGDATPSTADHTDFGSTTTNDGTLTRIFTIENTGSINLNLTSTTLSGTDGIEFSFTSRPSSPVPSSGSTTFVITFRPRGGGTRTARIIIENDDPNETPYIFAIQGTGFTPEINVKGNNTTIADGDTTPSTPDGTDFGAANIAGGTVMKTFTIENSGAGDLTLTGTPRVGLSGTNSADFSITTQPVSPVAATNGTTMFVVSFDPSALGTRTATVNIFNNDENESPYNFAIRGTGCSAPGISVPPQSQTVCESSSVTFSVTATGNGLSYQWRKGGVDIPGATSAIYTIASALAGDAGNYDVIVTGICGSVTSSVATLTVNACSPNNGLQFYPLARPVRLLDTRAGQTGCDAPGAMIPGGTARTQTAAGRTCDGLAIPANAKALTGNITTVQSGGGFLTLFPSDVSRPLVANSNFMANQVLNNAFTVGLGASDGAFNIYVTTNTNVVIDITGYYAPPSASGLYFHSLPRPVRLLDTRTGQSACFAPGIVLPANSTSTQIATTTCDGAVIPAGAQALVGNATTVGPQTGGWLTFFPADAVQPLVASSNFQTGDVMNAPFTVGLSPSGQFNVFTTSTTDLVIDVLGYYSSQLNDTNGQGLLFNVLPSPIRLLDTRAAQSGCFTPEAQMIGGVAYLQTTTGTCTSIPATARAVSGNATTVNVSANGYLTFWPSDVTQPSVATSNYRSGAVFNRYFTVGLGSDGAFKRFASRTTDLVIDLSGYFAP
ncbi:MAG: beta strand repeat-containing protein [Blastocatellia bacterium]